MKLRIQFPAARRQAGVTLIECLVYVSVFAILLGIGTASFYFCWDHTRATIATADRIEATIRAGECWRADVRAATGKITSETTDAGELFKIPERAKVVVYRYAGGELWREVPAQNTSWRVLEKVQASAMVIELHDTVTAWRWEMQLNAHRLQTAMPLRFTFKAVQANP